MTRRIVLASSIAAICSGLLAPVQLQMVFAAGNYSIVVGNDNPIGYWRLDDTTGTTAADSSSAHANPLTYQGGFTLATQPGAISGDPDPGVSLDGTTGTLTATKATTTSTANWSLEAWVNPSSLPQAGVIAYDGQLSSNGYGFAIGSTNGASLSSGSHLIGILGSVTMFDSGYNFSAPSTWYHVVMTRDTSTTRLYVNGVAQTTTSTQTPVAPGARFSLGSGFTSTPTQMFPLAGRLDEAASFNSALSAGRVQAHYTEGAASQSAFGNWISVSPTNPPSARFEPAMGWDAGHNKVVLFGGKNSAGSAIQETWTWDGTTWSKLSPSTQPSARWGAQLVYDTSLGKMVLFGGNSGKKALSDTWTWDGTTWAQLSPGTSPSSRYEYGLAYDSGNSVVVLFGGFSGSAALQDTFTFNGTTWTSKSPSAKPSIRSQVAMTYDNATSTTVLFGGVNGSTYNAETWTWNGSNWTQRSPGATPSARSDSGLAYSSLISSLVLFGGVNVSSYFGDTWTWDGTNWTQQLPASSPTVRAGAGFAYNGVIGADSLFGGLSGSTFLNDTKAWATPPGASTSVTASGGNAQATVSWTAPANGGSAITGYVVTPYAGSVPGTSSTPSSSPVTITGLTNGTAYTFKVAAKNAIGTGPVAVSNSVTPATVPGAPTSVTAVPGNAAATVSWTAPSSNGGAAISSYSITGSPAGSATLTCPCTPPLQQTVSTLTNGTTYTFTVKANNSAGAGPASSASAPITAGAPTAPQTPSATAGVNQAIVSWTAPASSNGGAVTGYVITAYLGTTAENRVNTNASATSVTVSGLVGSSQYTFQIVATNPWSSPAATTNAVTPTGSTSTYFTTVHSDGPVAYWRLDDPSGTIASDSSGNGHDGAYNGGVTYSAVSLIPSDPDPAITLDGGNGTYVSAPSLTALQGDNTRTVEVWFKTTNGNSPTLFDSGESSCGTTGQAFDIFLTGNGLYGNPPHGTPGIDVAFCNDDVYLPDLNLADGNFHQIVVTLSASSVGVYVDGRTPQGSVWNGSTWTALGNQPFTLPTTPNVASGAVWIGASHGVAGNHLQGTIDEVAVYSTVLSATQVANHDAAAQVTLSAPVIATTTAGTNQINVTWTDSSNPSAFSGYVVTAYSGATATVSKAVPSSATSATLTGLVGGTAYTVKISLSNPFSSVSTTSISVTPTGTSSTYASTVQSSAPLVYYRLGDSGSTIAADSSGSGQNGVYVGTPTFAAGGALANDTDTSVTFGSGYVAYSGAGMPTGNSARTIELWIKTTSTAGNQQLIGWGDCSGFNDQFDVRYNGGSQIVVNVCSSRTNPYINLPYSISNGQWHQLIITFDGSTIVVYVDGNRASSTTPGSLSTTRTGVSIGNGFQGSIDELAVYSGAFTASQAMAHFLASGNSQPTPPATVTATAGANSASVTWTASPTNPYPVLGYMVTAFNGTQAVNSVVTGPSTTNTTISGLQGGVTYTFAVSAINNFGFGSSTSSPAVTPTGASSTYASNVIGTGPAGNGPIVYYRLGEASGAPYAADSSGNGGWAIYNSGVTLGGAGALPSDGDTSVSGSFFFNTGNGIPTGNASRSVELWLKTTSTSFQSLVDWGDNNSFGSRFLIQVNNDQIVINLNNPTNPGINASYTLANGRWHYVAITFNGSQLIAYVDGSSIGTWSGSLGTDASGLVLGNGFSGNLDEVAIYSRVLSQTEITAHFLASGNSQPTAPSTVSATAGANSATVTWSASAANLSPITGYLVTSYSGGGAQYAQVVGPTVTHTVLSGLVGGVPGYTFDVAGINNFGVGLHSAQTSAVTPTGGTTYASAVLASSPTMFFRLGDGSGSVNAADSSGADRLANLGGIYTVGAAGAIVGDPDTALGLTQGQLQYMPSAGIPVGSSARSLEMWIRTTSTGTASLAGWGDNSNFRSHFQFDLSNGNQLILFTNNDDHTFTASKSLADGFWHYIVLTYDGNVTLTVYVDGTALPTQTLSGALVTTSISAGIVAGQDELSGNNPFAGTIDELGIYNKALTASDVSNHFIASGEASPNPPTSITVTPSVDSAAVSWTAPSPRGAPVTQYVVTPIVDGGSAQPSITVPAASTSVNVTGLRGGGTYTFQVYSVNQFGGGATGSSASASVNTPHGFAGLGQDLFFRRTTQTPPRGIYNGGWVSQTNVPAASTWTVEGFIWGVSVNAPETSNMAWGLLGGSSSNPSAAAPVAGINFNIGQLGGLSGGSDVSFVWPGGSCQITNGSIPTSMSGASPAHWALDYDGTTVRAFINGVLQTSCTTVTGGASVPAASAGFYDQSALVSGYFDEFRISNTARYTANFNPTSTSFVNDANTMLLYNFSEYSIGKLPPMTVNFNGTTPFVSAYHLGAFADWSGHGNHASMIGGYNACCPPMPTQPNQVYQPYILRPGLSPDEVAGGGSPWECSCHFPDGNYPIDTGTGEFWHTFNDLSIGGRGPGLNLTRTYSSERAPVVTRFGAGWSDSYDENVTVNGTIVTLRAGNGSAVMFTNNAGVYVAASQVIGSLTTDGSGNFIYTDSKALQHKFVPEPGIPGQFQLSQLTDRNGYVVTLNYDPTIQTQLDSISDQFGRSISFTYAGVHITTARDSAGRTLGYTYTGNQLTQVVDIGGGTWVFTYDSNNLLLTMKDPVCTAAGSNCNGGTGLQNVYNSSGQVTQQTDYMGRTTKYDYTGVPYTTKVTDPLGNISLYEYVGTFLLSVTKEDPAGNVVTTANFGYDPATAGSTLDTDGNGDSTTATRDAQANITTATDAIGRSTSMSYNTFNEPTSSIDAGQVQSSATYDGHGNLTQVSRPLVGSNPLQTATTTYTYGDTSHPGDLTQITDANGKVWKLSYDSNGYRISSADPAGDQSTYVYDSIGRLLSSVSPKGNVPGCGCAASFTTTYTVNAWGQNLTATDPLSNKTTLFYDQNDHLTTATDANNNTTTYTFNLDGEQTEIDRQDGSKPLRSTYDADGNVTIQTDGLNHTITFTYDALNRKTTSTDALSRTTRYSYDAVGNLTSVLDANGATTTYTYDLANQPATISYSDGHTPNVAVSYDGLGNRVSMTDGTGTSTYGYDSLGRLTQATNGGGAQVRYGYDLKGQLTSITYPGGVGTVTRAYDDTGRLSTISDWLGHTFTIKYDPNSNVTEVDYPGSVVSTMGYDNANRLTSIVDANGSANLLNFTYSRDNIGQVTADGVNSFSYDTVNRVSTEIMPSSSVTYGYDSADRPTSLAIQGGDTTTNSYDIANQLQTSTTTNGPTQVGLLTYGYDANGNRTSVTDQSNNLTSYTYDQANRLVGVGTNAQYTYNGDGLRQSKTVAGVAEPFVWDASNGLPLVVEDGSTYFIYGPGGHPIEQVSGTTARYYLSDQLGSTEAITDSTGAVIQSYTYDAYGNITASTGSVNNPFLFTGQYLDSETGFYYLRARFYDPKSESFLSKDPVALANPAYTYANDGPTKFVDPTGNFAFAMAWLQQSGDVLKWTVEILEANFGWPKRTVTYTIALFVNGFPYGTPQSYTANTFGLNQKTGTVPCETGDHWQLVVTVKGGKGGSAGASAEHDCVEPEPAPNECDSTTSDAAGSGWFGCPPDWWPFPRPKNPFPTPRPGPVPVPIYWTLSECEALGL